MKRMDWWLHENPSNFRMNGMRKKQSNPNTPNEQRPESCHRTPAPATLTLTASTDGDKRPKQLRNTLILLGI